jgi:DNA-binding NtrC family response regulator
LLLDEIGDLPLSAQAVFLRVLQEEEVQAVGATRPVKVDLRVIAATHRDLEKLALEEKFRPDLLARLAGLVIHLPALRERREDLGLLVAAILQKRSFDGTKTIAFTAEAARALLFHDWPRNVRELEKCLVGAVVLSEGGVIELMHLSPEVRSAPSSTTGTLPVARPSQGPPHDEKYDELIAQLDAHDWNVTETARAMGKARSHIQRLLRRYGVKALPLRRRAPPT